MTAANIKKLQTILKSVTNAETLLLNCVLSKQKMAVFPPNPVLEVKSGKTYIKNLKPTLAHTYSKRGVTIKLTDKKLKQYGITQPPVGWWMSEKYDGIRFIWDGLRFLSRDGKAFTYVPEYVRDFMPKSVALDGEIWMGRNNFQTVVGISNLKPGGKYSQKSIDKVWDNVTIVVFDVPSHPGTFEQRIAFAKDTVNNMRLSKDKCSVRVATNVKVKSNEHLMEFYDELTSEGAEGAMLRAPTTPYIPGRTNLLLKLKLNEDAEAVVVGYCEGTGKYNKIVKGATHKMLGSLLCRMIENGKVVEDKEFGVGTGFDDITRTEYRDPTSKHYIPIGAMINFSYMEKTEGGIPRHPVFRGVREDMPTPVRQVPASINALLVSELKKLVTQTKTTKEANWTFKVGSYNKAIKCISSTSVEITTVPLAIQELRKCGSKLAGEEAFFQKEREWKSSILQKIQEIQTYGRLSAIQSDPKVEAIQNLTTISGIGEAKALSLFTASGIKTVEALKTEVAKTPSLLTGAQKIGLKHHADLLLRIPRKEMELWNKLLTGASKEIARTIQAPKHLAMLTGSYRRNAKDSGDIDILLSHDTKHAELRKEMVKHLKEKKIITDIISSGKSQTFAVAVLPGTSTHRRIDLFDYSPDVYPFALLHSTGSGNHNQKMRAKAKDMGLSLSQYGFKKNSKSYKTKKPITSEKDIYEFLNMDYVEPPNRE